MNEIINKLQSAMQIADDPTLYDLLLSIRRDANNKWLEQQQERRKIVNNLKAITDNRVPDWVRKKLEAMILELEKSSV